MQRIAFIPFVFLICLTFNIQVNAAQDKTDPSLVNTTTSTTIKDYADEVESLARSKPALAIEISDKAMQEANPLFDPHSYGRLLNATSYALYLLNRYEEAMRKAKLAERIALRHELDDIMARSQMRQANVLKRIGEYTRAINQYTEAEKYYEQQGDKLFHSYVLNNIANIYLLADLVPSSIGYFEKSLAVNQQSSAYKGMADALFRQEKYELSLQNFEKALELYIQDDDTFGVTMVRNGQAAVYLKLGQTDKALSLFQEALRLAETYEQNFTREYSSQGIANTYFTQGKYPEAQHWVEQAIDIAIQVKDKEALLLNIELQAKIYEAQDRFKDALTTMQELRRQEKEYQTERDYTQLVVMQALFESDEKAAEIAELAEKNKVLQLENAIQQKNSQTARFTSIVLIIALLSFSFWIYYVNREKSRLARLSAELEKAKATAEHATKTKSAFLANMSHEIRTPLTSIIGYADSILQGDIPTREEHRVIKIISENGNHLLSVISDILDFTKIEANKLEFEYLATPLFPLFTQIESVTGKRARDKGLDFDVKFHFPLPNSIITDPTRLRQILFNLTNNALKFTTHGSINLSVKAVSDNLLIAVKDTGIGIKKENQKGLFTPFTQADGSINRRFGGSGLGLSISQHLANGLGGQIDFFSEDKKGSEFIVSIALKEAPDCQWVDSFEDLSCNSDKQNGIEDIPEYGKARVLLAEDHPNNRELICMMLRRLDLEVTSVENGQLACEAALESDFDLIFLDIQMPIMDGIQALKNIKKHCANTPIIALTANNMKHEVEQYLEEGFDDHLPKPLPREQLVQKLDIFLQRSPVVDIDDVQDSIVAEAETMPTEPEIQLFSPPKDEMVSLLKDYIQHLQEDIEEALFCWQRQDWARMSELSHSIKGSAGGFGFSAIGLMFDEVDSQVRQENYAAAISGLDKALGELNYFRNLPHIDLAVGLYNYGQDLDEFHRAIVDVTVNQQDKLALLVSLLGSEKQEATKHLGTLMESLKKLGMVEGAQLCQRVVASIDDNTEKAKELLTKLSSELSELREYLR